jgi:lipopolysaccharide export system protein LptA
VTWQRSARLVVALVGVGCAVAVYVLTRKRPEPAPLPAVSHADRAATVEAGPGTFTRRSGDAELVRITYESSRTYPDGHLAFDHAHIVSASHGLTLWADTVETGGTAINGQQPGHYNLTGHVRVVKDDGLTVTTDSLTYDDASGMAAIPGRLNFTRGRMTGEGQGATYDRDHDVLTIASDAHVTIAPDANGAGGADATARAMTMDRAQKYARLDDHARIVRSTETLAADTAILNLTDDMKDVRAIELHGHASMSPGDEPGPSPPPDMRANDMTLSLYPGGETLQQAVLTGDASVVLADRTGRRSVSGGAVALDMAPDGRTLTRLTSDGHVVVHLPASADTPARTILAPALVAQGNAQAGLTAARFDGGVTFEEQPSGRAGEATVRTGKARVLVLALGGQLDAIKSAEFRQQVTFTDGDTHADADLAQYDAGKGLLQLRPGGRDSVPTPRVRDGDLTVLGREIDVQLDSHDLDARGDVKTETKPSNPAGTAPRGSLFDEDKPIHGAGAALHYSSQTGQARYTAAKGGAAIVLQEENQVEGDEVVVESTTHNLNATGHVTSRFLVEPAPDRAASASSQTPTVYHATADTLVYTETDRTATYTGNPVTLDTDQGQTVAKTVTLVLAAESRSVERLVADGDVFSRLGGGDEAAGAHLVYEATTDRYTLQGMPARVKRPETDRPGCTKAVGSTLVFTRTSGTVQGSTSTTSIACSVSIR